MPPHLSSFWPIHNDQEEVFREMQVNEPEQRSSLQVPATRRSLEVSGPSPIMDADAGLVPCVVGYSFMNIDLLLTFPTSSYSDQYIELEDRGRRHESTSSSDDLPPPLGVKLTGYRLLNMSVVIIFATVKAILTYMGRSVMPTTLDWLSGGFLAIWWVF